MENFRLHIFYLGEVRSNGNCQANFTISIFMHKIQIYTKMHQTAFLLHRFCQHPIFFYIHLRIIFLPHFKSTGCLEHASSLLVFRGPSTLPVVCKKTQQVLFARQPKLQPRLEEDSVRWLRYRQVSASTMETADSPRDHRPLLLWACVESGMGLLENCICHSPQIPVPGHGALRTGRFFTNSWYILDRVPPQLFLCYQPHVVSWDEFFSDFSIQITCTWTGMIGCWQGH